MQAAKRLKINVNIWMLTHSQKAIIIHMLMEMLSALQVIMLISS